jgi:hypothetical protein
MNQTTKNKTIGIVMIVMGFLALLIASGAFLAIQKNKTDSISAMATVVDYGTNSYNGKTEYQVIFEYQDNEGDKITFIDPIANYSPRFELNEKVEILYIPNEPYSETIKSSWDIYFLTGIFTLFGIGSLVFGFQFYRSKINFKNKVKRGKYQS